MGSGLRTAATGQIVTGAFLRLNEFYLLFADPVLPFVSARGHLMVPARVVGALLGMDVRFDARGGVISVQSGAKRGLIITRGAAMAEWAGASYPMPVPALPLPGTADLLVPIAVLAHALGEPIQWNARTRTATIRSRQAMKTASSFDDLQTGYLTEGAATDDFAPVSLALLPPSREARFDEDTPTVVFTMRNVSGRNIARGGAILKTLNFTDPNGVAIGGVPYNSPDIHTPMPPPVRAGATLAARVPILGGYGNNQIRCIVAVPQRSR